VFTPRRPVSTWLLNRAQVTTVIVTLDHAGNVASVRVPSLTATRDSSSRCGIEGD
jgi:hypothetical protein